MKAAKASTTNAHKMPHIEVAGTSYLFAKRLNPNKGTFPLFSERIKRKLGESASMSKAEAGALAVKLASDLDHLQATSKRDIGKLPNATKDLHRAVKTWLWVVNWTEEDAKGAAKRTTAGFEAHSTREYLVEQIKSLYTVSTSPTLFTPLGDALLNSLDAGAGAPLLSESVTQWAEQTNRSHLDEQDKSIHDTKRYVSVFAGLIADKPLDQITRQDVAKYISARLSEVKTTSVEREISALRAVWNRAANAADIRTRNPFEEQPIKGLGTDSVARKTPTKREHSDLLKALMADNGSGYSIPLIAVIALTGLRLAEAWGLEEADWDRDANILNIRPNSVRRLKTNNSERPFPVGSALEPWLDRLFRQRRAATANSASAALGSKLKQLCPGLTAHGLRHGMKQRLVEVDATASHIDELMGWSQQNMRQHYGVNTITDQKRVMVNKVYGNLLPVDESSNVTSLFGREAT